MTLQVMTASLLKEGLVAYLRLEGDAASWMTNIKDATAAGPDDIEKLKRAAELSESENRVIAPYPIDVVYMESGPEACSWRERIRASGPTIQLPKDSSFPDYDETTEPSSSRYAA